MSKSEYVNNVVRGVLWFNLAGNSVSFHWIIFYTLYKQTLYCKWKLNICNDAVGTWECG